jgi:positive regulator of sigma E activity
MDIISSDLEKGIVTALVDNEAIVELNVQDSCESCGARMVCVPDNNGMRQLRATNPLNAHVGNLVTISEKSNVLLMLSFFQYGVPLVGFMLGVFLFSLLNPAILSLPQELILFSGGLVGLSLCAYISHHFIKRLASKRGSFFTISEIINKK